MSKKTRRNKAQSARVPATLVVVFSGARAFMGLVRGQIATLGKEVTLYEAVEITTVDGPIKAQPNLVVAPGKDPQAAIGSMSHARPVPFNSGPLPRLMLKVDGYYLVLDLPIEDQERHMRLLESLSARVQRIGPKPKEAEASDAA